MKTLKLLLIIFFFVGIKLSMAQNRYWTWISGDSIKHQPGTYGNMGLPDPLNTPGSRTGTVKWTDNNGNLWLFGGEGHTNDYLYLNDLWKFNVTTKQWTWVNGSSETRKYGIYGTMGVSDPDNQPGCRYDAVSWTDNDGNFWLYGGVGYGETVPGVILNDLWKYDPNINQWAWMHGTKNGEAYRKYGVLNTPASTNTPGSRFLSMTWVGNNGNLYLFGGRVVDSTWGGPNVSDINDMWMYDISINEWIWIGGAAVVNSMGDYGVKGAESSANLPGARSSATVWKDLTGNFWMFAGYGASNPGHGAFNDLWKFNPVSNQWTWVNGDSTYTNYFPAGGIGSYGNYGVKNVESISNEPGSRVVAAGFTGLDGNLYLFGGSGYAVLSDSNGIGQLNDLWKYNISNNQWTWIDGDSVRGVYGIYGSKKIEHPDNKPGCRTFPLSWTDHAGNFWLFGGLGYGASAPNGYNGHLNDLWRYGSAVTSVDYTKYSQSSLSVGYQLSSDKNLKLTIHSDKNQNVTCRISDLLGRVIEKNKFSLREGDNEFTMNVPNIRRENIYFLSVISEDGTITKKMIY